jgi:hypothetical protein
LKIIASDYDGTFNHHGISEKNREAVKKWRAAGNLFGIVTGRDGAFIKNFTNEVNVEMDFLIIYNGVNIYDFKGDGGQPRLIKQLLGKSSRIYDMLPLILRKEGDWAEVVTPDKTYYTTYNDEPAPRDTWVKSEAVKEANEFIQIYSLYKTEAEALEVARRLSEDFGGDLSPMVNGSWLNAAPPGVTKSTGVWEYAKLASVAREDIYTIGDSYNDLAMLRDFNGYTLEHGAAELKKSARAVYGGVWEMIENIKY